jgi:hypothetical protein
MEATKHKTNEEQVEGILQEEFFFVCSRFWNKQASGNLKTLKKQVAQLQDQLSDLGEEMWEKVPLINGETPLNLIFKI